LGQGVFIGILSLVQKFKLSCKPVIFLAIGTGSFVKFFFPVGSGLSTYFYAFGWFIIGFGNIYIEYNPIGNAIYKGLPGYFLDGFLA